MIDAMLIKGKKVLLRQWALRGFVFLFGILLSGLPAFAAEDEGVKQYGVVFDIAKDRKVENAGGLYQPEGLDKYMKRLTDDLGLKIAALEDAQKRTEKKLDEALALLKEQKSKEPVVSNNPPPAKVRNIFR